MVSTTKASVGTTFRVLYWWRRQQCKQISDGCLEKFKRIFTLITVTVLFFFAFLNLILEAPCSNSILFQHIGLHVRGERQHRAWTGQERYFFFPWWWIPEGFVTQWAAEVSLSCMTSWMCFQIARSCKKHWTKSTNERFTLLYEFLNVLSDCHVLQNTVDKEYNWMVSLLYDLLCEFWAVMYPWKIY